MNIQQEKQTKLIIEISKLVSEGYMDEFSGMVAKINEKKAKDDMPSELRKIYKQIGNTPIDEPEVYEMSKKIVSQELSIIDLLMNYMSVEDMDKYSIDEVSFLAGEIIRKVNAKKDEDGTFKTTPNLKSWQPPKPSHIKKFETLSKKVVEGGKDALKEMEDFLFEASCVDAENLSEWEKELSTEQTQEAILGYVNSFMGKR